MGDGKLRTSLFLIVCVVMLLISLGQLFRQESQYQIDQKELAPFIEPSVSISELESPKPAAPSSPVAPKDPIMERLAGIDLEGLQELNPDIIGWIEIPNTELSYPLLQGPDNQYYLSHNYKKEKTAGGSVFLETTNAADLSDFHSLIYAHRMRNDTMFGILKYYDSLSFWEEHPCFYTLENKTVCRYDIFSAEEAPVAGIVFRADLQGKGLEEEFLQTCVSNSVIDTGIIPNAEDRVVTLSTCTGSGHKTRWVVHGILAEMLQVSH